MRRTLASVLVALAAAFLASCDVAEPSSGPSPRSGPLPAAPGEGCPGADDEAGLSARAVAVDATVESVRRHGRRVGLHVTEWLRGGSAEALEVAGLGDPGSETDPAPASGPAYDVGTRLLISGQYAADGSLVVPHCGSTRYWTREELATWREIFGSTAAALPDDRATVPYVPYGASEREVVRLLASAGLDPVVPDVDWPHYVTGVDPAAGTELPVGAEVEILIGDG